MTFCQYTGGLENNRYLYRGFPKGVIAAKMEEKIYTCTTFAYISHQDKNIQIFLFQKQQIKYMIISLGMV